MKSLKNLKLISWNVNGVRAAQKKGFIEWLLKESPDILCIQETKAHIEQLNAEIISPLGYKTFWSSGERKGYSGVATFTKDSPKKTETAFGIKQYDNEGRILIHYFEDFVLFNIYFPNGQRDNERLKYKLGFYDEFLKFSENLRKKGNKIIICGDINTAHKEIDLARPKENINNSGFLPIEREWMDKLVNHGYVDTFRMFNNEGGNYTYWDTITRARERNVGWRIDYFFISEDLKPYIKNAFILPEIMGSDHCPVGIEMAN